MKFSNTQFEVTQYLGNMVGKKDAFLNKIAMMSTEYRELYSYLEVIAILSKFEELGLTEKDQKTIDAIREIVQRLGQADFPMDVVSHLAMKIGKAYKAYDGE